MIGDWMGSIYGVTGRRHDIRLFLDHDGRYEWSESAEPSYAVDRRGRWESTEGGGVISLHAEDTGSNSRTWNWAVLNVTGCEESNLMLVLRGVVFGSRNLPIIFYRVHCDGRGYGTGWQERLAATRPDPSN